MTVCGMINDIYEKINYKKIVKKHFLFFIFCFIFFFTSCATKFTYYNNLKELVKYENYNKAISLIDENKLKEYREKNLLLYLLDDGIIKHYAGNYQESIRSFAKAEKLAEELYTKSISEEVKSFLISDNEKSYYGEDFERVYINIFQALNYLLLGDYENALVEARKVDHKLKTLKVNYGNKNVFKEDAFMRYLAGLIYENEREYNDAYISFRKSIDEYSRNNLIYTFALPTDLLHRTVKITKQIGFKEEFEEINKSYKLNFSWDKIKYDTDEGEVVIIHYNGFAPYKIDHFIEVSFGEGWAYVGSVEVGSDAESDVRKAGQIARSIASDEQFVVAFPKFVGVPTNISYATVDFYKISNSNEEFVGSTDTFIVEDVETIAIKSLEDRIAAVRIKAIARAAIKFALSRAISKEIEQKTQDEFTRWLAKKAVQVTATATEKSDKRSWQLLPKNIYFATKKLPPGTYKLEIKFFTSDGKEVVSKTVPNVVVQKNKKVFIPIRTAY
jgi:hypothetical protein